MVSISFHALESKSVHFELCAGVLQITNIKKLLNLTPFYT